MAPCLHDVSLRLAYRMPMIFLHSPFPHTFLEYELVLDGAPSLADLLQF